MQKPYVSAVLSALAAFLLLCTLLFPKNEKTAVEAFADGTPLFPPRSLYELYTRMF